MAARTAVVLPAFEFEGDDLGRSRLLLDRGLHEGLLEQRRADGGEILRTDHQHLLQMNVRAHVGQQFLGDDQIALADFVLPSSDVHDGK